MLAVLQTHPIQYQAPIYRYLQQELNVPVTAIYGSDFSVAGYRDSEFGVTLSWDTDLLSGYSYRFLSKIAEGGSDSPQTLTGARIAETLAEIQPAAVLITGYGFKFNRTAFWYAWRNGYTLLFRGDTTDVSHERNFVKANLRDAVLRWYYRQFTALLPVGHNSTVHYQRLVGDRVPTFLSPLAVDTSPFAISENDRTLLRAATRQYLSIQDDQCVILFSGKLIDKKAPDLLLESIKRLPAEERKKTVILFLGDGPLRSSLEAAATAEPVVRFHFLGFKNQTELSPYYHAADLLVLPSRYRETWGLVVNEALHHGLPCVVSDRVGCASDLVINGETGEIFPYNEADALTAALQRAMGWLGTPTVREQCHTQIANYTIEKAAIGIANAYKYVIQK